VTGVKQCRSTGSQKHFPELFFHQINFPIAGKERFREFIIFMGPLGYLPASFLYLFGLFFFVSRFKWFVSAGVSGVLAAGSWYFFGKILGIFLPLGLWNL